MDTESDLIGMPANDLNSDGRGVSNSVGGVRAVGESTLDEWERFARGYLQRHRAVTVLDRGSVGLEHESATIGVDQRMTLTPIHLLASIVAARTACLGGLDALAVEHRGGGACLPTRSFAVARQEMVVDRLEHAFVAQTHEPSVNRRTRGEAVWYHAPRAA